MTPRPPHRRFAGTALILAAFAGACHPLQPGNPPPLSSAPATAPASQAADSDRKQEVPPLIPANDDRPKGPARPPLTWTKFVSPFDEKSDADIRSAWTGGPRLEVKTQNVRRMIIDLGDLPRGAPKKGPWNLQIDGQGIEVTGRRGRFLEMTRSDAGVWRATGPPPRN